MSNNVLVKKRIYNGRRWSDWEVLFERPPPRRVTRHGPRFWTFPLPLPLGGEVTIYPDLIPCDTQQIVSLELKAHPHYFREYNIQGTYEPRAHFLAHEGVRENVVEDSTTLCPGYKYGHITMKAMPLHLLPELERLSNDLKAICSVECWNIGVNPVYYRGGRDSMGNHADNDQGENLILTVLVESPSQPRRVVIRSNSKKLKQGDEEIELTLSAGDAYTMDGVMQESYVHGVPKDNAAGDRIAIVFRVGQYCEYARDSGRSLATLEARPEVQQVFGPIPNLNEGECYSRFQLLNMGAHRSPQGGISGNKKDGCDSIVVSGSRKDGLGSDSFCSLVYVAESRVGAGAILTSMSCGNVIRVFRSSVYQSIFCAAPSSSTQYRYDGLYIVQGVCYFDDDRILVVERPNDVSPCVVGRLYAFQLERVAVGDDPQQNKVPPNVILETCLADNVTKQDVEDAMEAESFDLEISEAAGILCQFRRTPNVSMDLSTKRLANNVIRVVSP